MFPSDQDPYFCADMIRSVSDELNSVRSIGAMCFPRSTPLPNLKTCANTGENFI